MQNKVSNIVADYNLCKKLHDLGITNKTVFHYFKNGEVYEADQIENFKETTIAAYTYEELYILIGHKYGVANLPESKHPAKEKEYPPALQIFEVYFTEILKTYKKGSDGNAEILIYLIENKLIKVEEANERFKTKYR